LSGKESDPLKKVLLANLLSAAATANISFWKRQDCPSICTCTWCWCSRRWPLEALQFYLLLAILLICSFHLIIGVYAWFLIYVWAGEMVWCNETMLRTRPWCSCGSP